MDLFSVHQQVIFRKRQDDLLGNPKADRFLTQLPTGEYILFGIGIECSIRVLALGLLARHRRVTVITDACGYWDKGKADLGVEARPGALAESAVFRDTIGAATFYEGLAPLSVSGYGLVGGLGRNGSRDCPKDIYDGLVQELYKLQHRPARVVGVDQVTPEALINDLDTAVVVIRAVPTGSPIRPGPPLSLVAASRARSAPAMS